MCFAEINALATDKTIAVVISGSRSSHREPEPRGAQSCHGGTLLFSIRKEFAVQAPSFLGLV